MKTVDFENIEKKFERTTQLESWKTLVGRFQKAKKVYVIGNGGLHFVAAHMATDCSRLIPEKVVYSLDTTGYITSIANDHGFENIFVRWLETSVIDQEEDCMVIGMSCSGNSKNITRALSWAHSRGFSTALLSGQLSKRLQKGINEVCFDVKYFHSCEALCLLMFYQLIHETGHECPSIIDEIKRKDPWAV